MESLETRQMLAVDPIAEAGGPYTVSEGGTLVLDGSASYDPDGPNRIVSYAWDLDGDGSFGETGPDAVRGDETRIRPTFLAAGLDGVGLDGPGSYTVSLKVKDMDDRWSTSSDTVTISIANVAPTLSIDGAPTIQEGGAYTLNLSSSDPGLDTISQWQIDWGDGEVDFVTGEELATGNPSTVQHVYADGPATHRIRATVTDEDGTYSVGDPGTLNATFGERGFAQTNFSNAGDFPSAMARQNDGKLVSVGYGEDKVFRIVRQNSDGSPDTTFGTAGVVKTVIGMYADARSGHSARRKDRRRGEHLHQQQCLRLCRRPLQHRWQPRYQLRRRRNRDHQHCRW